MRVLLALALMPALVDAAAADFSWHAAANLATARSQATATVLPGGREILVAGGRGPERRPLATTEIFDSLKGTWRAAQTMLHPRAGHSAVRLADGRILVVGGGVAEAEVYSPPAGWQDAGRLPIALSGQVAAELIDGEVLVTGGSGFAGRTPALNRRTFLYDPRTNSWREAGPTNTPHVNGAAVLLRDGQLLLAGGAPPGGPSAELFALGGNDRWTQTGDMVLDRTAFALARLPNGDVLAAGGLEATSHAPLAVRSAEIYEFRKRAWRSAASLRVDRLNPAYTTLSDGSVLVVSERTGEAYDPAGGTWRWLPGLASNHSGGTAVAMSGDRALVIGGQGGAAVDLLAPGAPTVSLRALGQISYVTLSLAALAALLLAAVAVQAAWRRRSPYAGNPT